MFLLLLWCGLLCLLVALVGIVGYAVKVAEKTLKEKRLAKKAKKA